MKNQALFSSKIKKIKMSLCCKFFLRFKGSFRVVFSYRLSCVSSETESCQFLRIFLLNFETTRPRLLKRHLSLPSVFLTFLPDH